MLEPDAFREINGQLERSRQEQETLLARVVETLQQELNHAGIRLDRGRIIGRPKHVYSIYQKMQRPKYQGQGVGRIYDRLAIRVVVNDVRECYETLGVVHSRWKPIPGEVDDYIANPKTSGYQSLHTAVICEGQPLEIQIRTLEMQHAAEHGIAAHWRYKEGGKKTDAGFDQKLSWLRQLLEWHQELQDPREFVHSVKIDLFQNEVFVFTPKGDVIDLPAGATPVDFAFRIHTDIGYHTSGSDSPRITGVCRHSGKEATISKPRSTDWRCGAMPMRTWPSTKLVSPLAWKAMKSSGAPVRPVAAFLPRAQCSRKR